MKTSCWAIALFGTSVLAACGCQQTQKACCTPCATCAQQQPQRWPVAKESGQATVVSGGVNNNNEAIVYVPAPGAGLPSTAFPLPSTAFPRQAPSSLPTASLPPVVTVTPPPAALVMPLPPLPPPLQPLGADGGKTSAPANEAANASSSAASIWTAPVSPPPILPANVPTLPMSSPPVSAPIAAPAAPASASQVQGFSHSADYQVLIGQVQTFRQDWKLRYADYATVDPYGGSVVLEGNQLDRLQPGCQVRVQGQLIPPSDRACPARFQVLSVDVIGQ